jgi:type III secretion protein R
MSNFSPDLLSIIIVVSLVGLLPFAVVTMTSFLKISVVLFLLRNALGVQQSPPNLLLYGIALILTVYVTTPVVTEMANNLQSEVVDFSTADGVRSALDRVTPPLKTYLARFADEKERDFFVNAAASVWAPEPAPKLSNDDLLVLVPAYVSSELTRAFQIGFLLYLPFLVIDLIVSNVLMAMGMSMVSPTLISVPLKIFLIVAIGGWSRLMQGLVMSYVHT